MTGVGTKWLVSASTASRPVRLSLHGHRRDLVLLSHHRGDGNLEGQLEVALRVRQRPGHRDKRGFDTGLDFRAVGHQHRLPGHETAAGYLYLRVPRALGRVKGNHRLGNRQRRVPQSVVVALYPHLVLAVGYAQRHRDAEGDGAVRSHLEPGMVVNHPLAANPDRGDVVAAPFRPREARAGDADPLAPRRRGWRQRQVLRVNLYGFLDYRYRRVLQSRFCLLFRFPIYRLSPFSVLYRVQVRARFLI